MPGRDPVKYEMTEDILTVGREKGCTLPLRGDSGISRTHCRIRRSGGAYVLEDAGSSNGTRLNGEKIGGEARELRDCDRIGLGKTEIVFEDPKSPRRSWMSKMGEAVFGSRPGPEVEASRCDGIIKCGKCGAKIHIGGRARGQKVGCSRCRTIHVVSG
jgi:pSer/pThr/pTyr-binding forkhead associated (FHA) protein